MKYIYWRDLLPASIMFTLFAYVAAVFLPLFSRNNWLPRWLWWFQTPDNSLEGDYGWKNEHWQWRFKLPKWLATYVGQVGWLWRNPAYGFEWEGPLAANITSDSVVSWTGNPEIHNREHGITGFCLTDVVTPTNEYWHYCLVKDLGVVFGQRRCLYLNFGWKLKTYAEDTTRVKTEPKAMYTFSCRITTITLGQP